MRLLMALAAALAVSAVAYGAAASLIVTGGVTQAGEVASLECDPDGVHVEGYGVELNDLTGHGIKISGIDAACAGEEIAAQIQTTGGNFNVVAVIPGGGGTVTIPFPAPVPLADIIGVHLVIG